MKDKLLPIEVETSYTYPQMKAFYRFQYRKMRKTVWLLLGILTVSLLMAALGETSMPALNVLQALLMSNPLWPVLSAVLLLAMLAYLFGVFYTQRKYDKTVGRLPNTQSLILHNTEIIVRNTQPEFEQEMRLPYKTLKNVWETKDMFYLFLPKQEIFLVSKNGFVDGTSDKLREFLRDKVGFSKYKIKK